MTGIYTRGKVGLIAVDSPMPLELQSDIIR